MFRPIWPCVLLIAPAFCATPSREILELQRDVARLQEQVKFLIDAQTAGIARLEALTQQAVESANKAGAVSTAAGAAIQEKLKEEDTRLATPLAETKTEVGQVSENVRTLQQAVSDLAGLVTRLQSQMTDVTNLLKVMQSPAQPPADTAQISATDLIAGARRDYLSGKFELALPEFTNYVKLYGDTQEAAEAQYYIGSIYYGRKDYESAGKAFDALLEKYPKSSKAPDALYYKASALASMGRQAESAAALRELRRRFPNHDLAGKPLSRDR